MDHDNDIASKTEYAAEEQLTALKHDDDETMAKSPSLVAVSAASQRSCAPIGGVDDASLPGRAGKVHCGHVAAEEDRQGQGRPGGRSRVIGRHQARL